MPTHVTGPAQNPNSRGYNRTLGVSKVLLAIIAVLSVAIAVYIAESYPKRKIPTISRVYQMNLPYDLYALEPYVSAETMDYHYNKHDYGYEKKLLSLVNGTDLAGKSLIEILEFNETAHLPAGVYNNAGQLMNHNIFWQSMTKHAASQYPEGLSEELRGQLVKDFKSVDGFIREFISKGTAHFGSGWVWVAYSNATQSIELFTLANGNYPSPPSRYVILFNCDVWEHAYYIDYRNEREEYLRNFLHVLNWEFASNNFANIH